MLSIIRDERSLAIPLPALDPSRSHRADRILAGNSTVSVKICSLINYRKCIILTPLGFVKRKIAKCLQQPVFPGGHPSKY